MDNAISLYIHWPFCKSKCPYCDFNSHVRSHIDMDQWFKAFECEIKRQAAYYAHKPTVKSVFFGGGTPSLMPPALVAHIIDTLAAHFNLSSACEITLEANPTSAEAANFKALQQAGVNRISVGVQSFDNELLQFLGRQHSAEEAIDVIHTVRDTFENFSFDLIYARPQDTWATWKKELDFALTFQPPHISLYQLTIETGTVFQQHVAARKFTPLDEETATTLYIKTLEALEQQGYAAYEVSNFARPGQACQHNLTYWRYEDYVGIGPGAHGRITINGTKYATKQYRYPEKWLEHALKNGGEQYRTSLSLEDSFTEHLMMGLRITDGIARQPFLQRYQTLWESYNVEKKARQLVAEGLLEADEQALRCTPEGRLRLNSLIAFLTRKTTP